MTDPNKTTRVTPVRMPLELLRGVDRLRAQLQAESPERVVTRSDVIRGAVASAVADMPGEAKQMTVGVFEPA